MGSIPNDIQELSNNVTWRISSFINPAGVLAMDVTYTYDNLYRLASDARGDIGRVISRASEDHYGSGESGRGPCTRFSVRR